MRFFFLVFIANFFLLCSCKEKSNNILDSFDKSVELAPSATLNLEEYGVLRAIEIMQTNEYYVLMDPFARKGKVTILNKSDNHKSYSVVDEGTGPLETTNHINCFIKDDSLYVLDGNLKKTLKVNIHSDSVYLTPSNAICGSIYPKSILLDNNHYISLCRMMRDSCWFSVKNVDGETCHSHPFPEDGVLSELSYKAQSTEYCNSWIALSPNGHKFVIATHHPCILGFGEVIDKKTILKCVKNYGSPKVGKIQDGYILFSKDCKVSFLRACCSNDHVFLLYCGRTFNESGMSGLVQGNTILVYKWDGTPYKIIKVHEELKSIGYDVETQSIFAIANEPEAILVEYSLKDVL